MYDCVQCVQVRMNVSVLCVCECASDVCVMSMHFLCALCVCVVHAWEAVQIADMYSFLDNDTAMEIITSLWRSSHHYGDHHITMEIITSLWRSPSHLCKHNIHNSQQGLVSLIFHLHPSLNPPPSPILSLLLFSKLTSQPSPTLSPSQSFWCWYAFPSPWMVTATHDRTLLPRGGGCLPNHSSPSYHICGRRNTIYGIHCMYM